MSLIAVIGAVIQLIYLVVTNWFKYADARKEERKVLYEEGKKAIASRDASSVTMIFDKIKRM